MNQNTNDYQDYLSLVNSLSDNEKAILSEYLNAHKEEFYSNPVDTFRNACLYAMEKLVSDFFATRENLIPDTDGDYAKSIYNQSQQERGKAFVESMSQPIRSYRESLQSSRDARYDNMIEEYEDTERKALIEKLKKELSRKDYFQIYGLMEELLVAPEFSVQSFENQMKINGNWDNFMLYFQNVIDVQKYSSLSKTDIVNAIKDVYQNYEEYSKSNDVRMGK